MKSFRAALTSLLLIVTLALALPALAWQAQSSSSTPDQSPSPTLGERERPIPQPVQLVPHSTKAVDYKQGSTSRIELKGTSLMPEATGDAEVKTRTGRTEIEAHLNNLKPANSIDLTYLTYVLWAISPDGRPSNIGELVVKDGKAAIKTAAPCWGR